MQGERRSETDYEPLIVESKRPQSDETVMKRYVEFLRPMRVLDRKAIIILRNACRNNSRMDTLMD